jgi:hypothetical protein
VHASHVQQVGAVVVFTGAVACFDNVKGGARMRPRPSHFDPTNPGHRTTNEWAVAGKQGWFHNAFVYALAHGEARVLLRAGVVLVLWWDAQTRSVQVEEL